MSKQLFVMEEEKDIPSSNYTYIWILLFLVLVAVIVYVFSGKRSLMNQCSPHEAAVMGNVSGQPVSIITRSKT